MSKKKFKKRFVIIPLLCIAIVGGASYFAIQRREANSVAKVVPVNQIEQYFGMNSGGIEVFGSLKNGSVQNVVIGSTLKVDKVNVKKGDTVKKGDILLTYDTKSLELNVEEIENKITAIENKEKIANNELNVLKNLRPSEDKPNDGEDDSYLDNSTDLYVDTDTDSGFKYETQITTSTKPFGGEGTAESPYTFIAVTDTVVKAEYLDYLAGDRWSSTDSEQTDFPESDNESTDDAIDTAETDNTSDKADTDEGQLNDARYALLQVYDKKGNFLFAWLLDGSKIQDEDIADWKCNEGVVIGDDGTFSITSDKKSFSTVVTQLSVNYGVDTDIMMPDGMEDFGDYDFDIPADNPIDTDFSSTYTETVSPDDNYIYSREELKKMISEKEKEIEQLGFEKKQAEIDLDKAKQMLDKGVEVSKLNGTVTFVASSESDLSDSGAYISISSDDGVSLVGSINEFQKSEIDVGMPVSITNYSDGGMYNGSITEISNTPSTSSDYGDNTMSYYEFTVAVDGELNLKDEDGVYITVNNGESSSVLCVEQAFVREESGSYYVMVANDDNIIEKRYVKVGRSYYGYGIDILSGLSEDDRIALPYGNTAEGMPVKDVEYNELYGMFYF